MSDGNGIFAHLRRAWTILGHLSTANTVAVWLVGAFTFFAAGLGLQLSFGFVYAAFLAVGVCTAAVMATLALSSRWADDQPLGLEFGSDEAFWQVEMFGAGQTTRRCRVKVINKSRAVEAKKVRVYCELSAPVARNAPIISRPFDLHPGEERFVDIVSWTPSRDDFQLRLGDHDNSILLDAVQTDADISNAKPLTYIATIMVVAEGLQALRERCYFGLVGPSPGDLELRHVPATP